MIYEIVILAMIAVFLGLRLYSVLGRRAEHEEEPVPHRFDAKDKAGLAAAPQTTQAPPRAVTEQEAKPDVLPVVERGVQSIIAADRGFDITSFLEGAKGAYGMILEAYWKGDKETLRDLCDESVYQGFAQAIDAREEAGETLDNRLIRIEDATIRDAELERKEARITVRFVADIAAVTHDRDGNMVAGSLDDAIESRDIWTFARRVDSRTPDWQLVETDEG
ncbi:MULTISPECIES: Tim44/TimA family putative adaptor protein [Citromicrobium]|uniref:Tim44/TimA family putative adaptor protein n=1 Tax=Citromicrobium TaxID=72173 RepID=UPI0001DD09BC|nr:MULTISPECIES: Tim44/TimA family putative adaptor protein [Citromicrobium]